MELMETEALIECALTLSLEYLLFFYFNRSSSNLVGHSWGHSACSFHPKDKQQEKQNSPPSSGRAQVTVFAQECLPVPLLPVHKPLPWEPDPTRPDSHWRKTIQVHRVLIRIHPAAGSEGAHAEAHRGEAIHMQHVSQHFSVEASAEEACRRAALRAFKGFIKTQCNFAQFEGTSLR